MYQVGFVLDKKLLGLDGVDHVRGPRVLGVEEVVHRERTLAVAHALVVKSDRLIKKRAGGEC